MLLYEEAMGQPGYMLEVRLRYACFPPTGSDATDGVEYSSQANVATYATAKVSDWAT
jgi:hypothetical protein